MADDHLLQPGTIIGGRYEVVKCLGSGSMGVVYACRHRELQGHLVSVKVLFPEVARDKVAAARFRNEIFASYGVSHPNVVRAYEYIKEGDLVAYTMEFIGGGDLAKKLSNPDQKIQIAEAVRLLAEICSGVQAIHDAGIVHRDLKPENIMLTKDGHVKITDFGIARTGHGPKLTEHGGVVGTLDYVSPEYMLNSHVDWRSDIYAIGILGYEMIVGESPFKGDSVYATMTKRLKSDPSPPSSLRTDCPLELDAIVLKAMNRNPEARYQSTNEMVIDLRAIASVVGLKLEDLPEPVLAQEHKDEKVFSSRRVHDESEVISNPQMSSSYASSEERSHDAQTSMVAAGASVVNESPVQRIIKEDLTRAPSSHVNQGIEEDQGATASSGGNLTRQISIGWQRPLAREPHEKLPLYVEGKNPLQVLAEEAQRASRVNSWLDSITAVVAIVVGIGFGLAFVRWLSP